MKKLLVILALASTNAMAAGPLEGSWKMTHHVCSKGGAPSDIFADLTKATWTMAFKDDTVKMEGAWTDKQILMSGKYTFANDQLTVTIDTIVEDGQTFSEANPQAQSTPAKIAADNNSFVFNYPSRGECPAGETVDSTMTRQ